MDPIFHLALRDEWSASATAYQPAAFATDGFVHCSGVAQVEATANRYFAGRNDLLLLTIDPTALPTPPRWEPPIDPHTGIANPASPDRFPHVYGPLPRAAVTAVAPLRAMPDSTFALRPHLPTRTTLTTAVIFDCDGVLFESLRANTAYYDAIRARLGFPPMDAAWRHRVHFLASSQVFAEMFGADATTLAYAHEVAGSIDYTPFFRFMDPMPGLHDMLASLHPHHRLAMATNRGSTVLEVVRRFELTPYLDAALGVRDVARPKPHPDLLEATCARLGVAPANALYVGDAETDQQAAQAAGLQFVAFGRSAWSTDAIDGLRDLPAFVRRRALDKELRTCLPV